MKELSEECTIMELKESQSWTHVVDKGVGVDSGCAGFFYFSFFYNDSVINQY